MSTHSRAYHTWRRRLESGTFTAAQCRAWCNVVNPVAAGTLDKYRKTTLEQREAFQLRNMMRAADGVELEPAHTAKGLAWIRNYHADKFPVWVLERFERFTFRGEGFDIGNQYHSHFVPVWRIHGTGGETLDYYAAAWQSGATGPRILRQSSSAGVGQ